jgi:hypothetical protein
MRNGSACHVLLAQNIIQEFDEINAAWVARISQPRSDVANQSELLTSAQFLPRQRVLNRVGGALKDLLQRFRRSGFSQKDERRLHTIIQKELCSELEVRVVRRSSVRS